jgi:hypothetical protein
MTAEAGLAALSAPQAPPRKTLPGLAIALVRRPGTAMRDLAEHPGWRWLPPTLLMAALSMGAAVATNGARQAAERQEFEQIQAQQPELAEGSDAAQVAETTFRAFGILNVIGGGIGPFVAVVFVAALFHLLGTVLGGQQGFAQILAGVAWARVPLAVQTLLRMAQGFAGGYDPSPEGLSGLVDRGSPLAPILAEVSVWNLWTLALLGVAMAVVARLPRRKAIAAVLVFVAFKVAIGETGVLVQRFAQGFAG